MEKNDNNKPVRTFRLSEEVVQGIKKICKENGCNTDAAIAQMLTAFESLQALGSPNLVEHQDSIKRFLGLTAQMQDMYTGLLKAMDASSAAATITFEKEIQIKNDRIRELEEEKKCLAKERDDYKKKLETEKENKSNESVDLLVKIKGLEEEKEASEELERHLQEINEDKQRLNVELAKSNEDLKEKVKKAEATVREMKKQIESGSSSAAAIEGLKKQLKEEEESHKKAIDATERKYLGMIEDMKRERAIELRQAETETKMQVEKAVFEKEQELARAHAVELERVRKECHETINQFLSGKNK